MKHIKENNFYLIKKIETKQIYYFTFKIRIIYINKLNLNLY